MPDKKSDSVAHFFGGGTPTVSEDLNFSLDSGADTETLTETEEALEGELAVDVYQDDNNVVIVSPIAGIDPDQIEIGATDDTITVSGERQASYDHDSHNVHTQEIYWGGFSRTVTLPVPCDVDEAAAAYEHGVLIIKIPKTAKAKKRTIKVISST